MSDLLVIVSLLDAARELAMAGGGDGEAWIVSSDYEWLADQFRKLEMDFRATRNPHHTPWFTNEDRQGNVIYFTRDQEFVAFTDTDPGVRPEAVFLIGLPLRYEGCGL